MGFVLGIGVQGLGSAKYGGKGLDRHPDNIVVNLLCRKGVACCLGMESEHQAGLVFSSKPFFHKACPQPPGRPELGHLLEQVRGSIEEESQPSGKDFQLQTGVKGCLDIGAAVGQGKGNFLHRC